jgi:hypothetical protein
MDSFKKGFVGQFLSAHLIRLRDLASRKAVGLEMIDDRYCFAYPIHGIWFCKK